MNRDLFLAMMVNGGIPKSDRFVRVAQFVVLLVYWVYPYRLGFAETPRIAAAASLHFVMSEVQHEYVQNTGRSVEFVFGSSKSLAHQIIAGAPFDSLMSADRDSIKLLQARGLTQGNPVVYGFGRLVLFKPKFSKLKLAADLHGLRDLERTDSAHRVAIADPDAAPYGSAAREALLKAGLLEDIRSRLVIGLNALQAAQFAISGSVDAAFIPYAIASNPRIKSKGSFVRVSDALYQPLEHQMVLTTRARNDAREFMDFLLTERASSILATYGLQ